MFRASYLHLYQKSLAQYNKPSTNPPSHADSFVARGETTEQLKEKLLLSSVSAAASSEHNASAASKPDQSNVQTSSQTGESIDIDSHVRSTITSQQMVSVDHKLVSHPTNVAAVAITKMSLNTVPSLEAELATPLGRHSSLGDHKMAKFVQVPFGATTAEIVSGNTQPSPTKPKCSIDNNRSDLASLLVAGLDVNTNLVSGNPDVEAQLFETSQAQQDGDSAGLMDLDEQNPCTVEHETTSEPPNGISESSSLAALLHRSLEEKKLPSDDRDATQNGTETNALLVAKSSPLSATDAGIGKEKRVSRKDVARSKVKADLLGAGTPGSNSTEATLGSKLQNLEPQGATMNACDSHSAMALESTMTHNQFAPEDKPVDGEEAEFATDSSPLEGTSSETSSLSSSSEDSDGDYKMLGPEEQARILMLGDGGSDDDGGKNVSAASKIIVKTQNERPEQIVEKPALIVTEEMEIEELGAVENLIDNTVLIKAKVSGEFQVLEAGSLLCLRDRSVIGVVAETLGRVHQPLYSILFTNSASIAEAGIEKGSKIFYVVLHSTFVFTQSIKNLRGSDASNIHDEEVGDDEMEFSDDEAEAAYKRNQKIQRDERRANLNPNDTMGFSKPARGRGHRSDRGRRDQGRQMNPTRGSDEVKLSYDDPVITVQSGVGDYDGPYIPLARPPGYSQINNGELLVESERPTNPSATPLDPGYSWRGRGRGDTQGPWRGRGRGHRRGQQYRGNHGGYTQRFDNHQSLPSSHAPSSRDQGPAQYSPSANPQHFDLYSQYQQPANTLFSAQLRNQSSSIPYSQNSSFSQHNQVQPQQNHVPQVSPPYNPQIPSLPPTSQQFSGAYPSAPYLPPNGIPQGAFINPAFFGQYTRSTGFKSSPGGRRGSNSSPGGQDAVYEAAQERMDVLRRFSQCYRPQ